MKHLHTLILTLALGLATTPLANAQTRTAAASPRPAAPAALAPNPLQVPSSEAQVIMIRSALLALSQANQTNNYSVLNALGSPNFQSANPAARLSEAFAPFRTNRIDLAPVSFINPRFTTKPVIENGRLRLVGLFPTAPMRVDYDLTFEPAGGQWRLFGLSVNLKADPPKK
jgi:hypothetical protein